MNGLVINPPSSPHGETFRWLDSERDARSYFVTLNTFLSVMLVEVMSADIERELGMELPLILKKEIEFAPLIVNICEDRLVDVYPRLPFLNIILILRRQPTPRSTTTEGVFVENVCCEFRFRTEEPEIAIINICFPCRSILTGGASENKEVSPI